MNPLGYIIPAHRTKQQHDAHAAAIGQTVKFSLPVPTLAAGQAVRLFDLWKHPDVIADTGKPFARWHQLTGSCVKAGGFNAVVSTICAQRVASDNPTKAFIPFCWHNYAMSRHYMGDDGQGEGSLGSTFAQSLTRDGIRDYPQVSGDELPEYTYSLDDGFKVPSSVELKWSSYRNPDLQKVLAVSKAHLFGSAAECRSAQDIKAMIVNGYGVTFACNNYIGRASTEGSGADACVIGFWDGRGGHQQSILGVWEHPQFGTLYWAQNNWDAGTYPRDPAGGPVCGCWVREAKVEAAMRMDGEVYGLSHLNYFPAQPKVVEVTSWTM